MFRRRLGLPTIVIVAIFLSIVLSITFLSRPTYLDQLPEVIPSIEDQLLDFGGRKGLNSQSDKYTKKGISRKNKGWSFNSARDANSYSLDSEQCNIAFPGLFAEIERGVTAQKALGSNIKPEQLNLTERGKGALRGKIYNNQVRNVPSLSNDLQ